MMGIVQRSSARKRLNFQAKSCVLRLQDAPENVAGYSSARRRSRFLYAEVVVIEGARGQRPQRRPDEAMNKIPGATITSRSHERTRELLRACRKNYHPSGGIQGRIAACGTGEGAG
jgi:hypothetical protein